LRETKLPSEFPERESPPQEKKDGREKSVLSALEGTAADALNTLLEGTASSRRKKSPIPSQIGSGEKDRISSGRGLAAA